MCVKEFLAQAPLQLSMVMKKTQKLMPKSLVPFIVTVKPQDSGDISFEV